MQIDVHCDNTDVWMMKVEPKSLAELNNYREERREGEIECERKAKHSNHYPAQKHHE